MLPGGKVASLSGAVLQQRGERAAQREQRGMSQGRHEVLGHHGSCRVARRQVLRRRGRRRQLDLWASLRPRLTSFHGPLGLCAFGLSCRLFLVTGIHRVYFQFFFYFLIESNLTFVK